MRRDTNMALLTVPHGVRQQTIEARAHPLAYFPTAVLRPDRSQDSFAPHHRSMRIYEQLVLRESIILYILPTIDARALIYGEAKALLSFPLHFVLTEPRLSECRSSPVNVR
jgi:hypothetical protein